MSLIYQDFITHPCNQKMRALFIEHDHVSLGGPIWRAFEKHGYEIERFLVVPESSYSEPNIEVTFPNFANYDLIVPMGAPYGAYEDERIDKWLLPASEDYAPIPAGEAVILGKLTAVLRSV